MPGTAGSGNLRGDRPFPEAAAGALGDEQLRRNLAHATGTIRAKRATVVGELDDWEQLRDAGSAIKIDAMARLPELLERLEREVTTRGGVVHWARDADEANRIVTRLVTDTGQREVVKVKSMATQEIGLNEALEAAGITATETDLAELIVQLDDDRPSHILVPAIHRNRQEIAEIFRTRMRDAQGRVPGGIDNLTDDPAALAEAARRYLREKFLSTRVAVSGANFAVAETGTLCVVESEGNGRMCVTLPDTLITVMGIEKVIPSWRDLEVFLQLLPRSSTGERMNPYTSLWTGVHAASASGPAGSGETGGDTDGPREFHLVLLDNGRTAALSDPVGRPALHCIRCSACLNACPVYSRTGGHAYGSTYPGPIGAILSPLLTGISGPDDPNASLPFASTLCGACYDVCPVKIDIPSILVHLRGRAMREGRRGERAVMRLLAWVLSSARRFGAAERLMPVGRLLARDGRIRRLPPPLSGWTDHRDLPAPPRRSFRRLWARRRAR
nr:lactate utilization protein B [Haloechinothrix sp. LS1_15]